MLGTYRVIRTKDIEKGGEGILCSVHWVGPSVEEKFAEFLRCCYLFCRGVNRMGYKSEKVNGKTPVERVIRVAIHVNVGML